MYTLDTPSLLTRVRERESWSNLCVLLARSLSLEWKATVSVHLQTQREARAEKERRESRCSRCTLMRLQSASLSPPLTLTLSFSMMRENFLLSFSFSLYIPLFTCISKCNFCLCFYFSLSLSLRLMHFLLISPLQITWNVHHTHPHSDTRVVR